MLVTWVNTKIKLDRNNVCHANMVNFKINLDKFSANCVLKVNIKMNWARKSANYALQVLKMTLSKLNFAFLANLDFLII